MVKFLEGLRNIRNSTLTPHDIVFDPSLVSLLAVNDPPMPICFSRITYEGLPVFALFVSLHADIDPDETPYACYEIYPRLVGSQNQYNYSDPVYVSINFDDISDIWSLYA